ncbi:MAG TPA: hypothetical protein PLQ01_05095 [Methanothrix sp.]|nr:hypothetical protein [Methanothrix sp.]
MEVGGIEVTLNLMIEIAGILAFVLTGAAYAGFRGKVKELFMDIGDAWAMTYAILGNILDKKDIDPARIQEAKTKIEEVWTEACALAPFVKDILNSIPKR